MFNRAQNQNRMTLMDLLHQDVSWKSIEEVLKYEIHITVKHEFPPHEPKKDRNLKRLEVELEAVKFKLNMLNETIHNELEQDLVKRVQAHADYRNYLTKKGKALEKKIDEFEGVV